MKGDPPLLRSAGLRIALGVAALLTLFSVAAMVLQYRALEAELAAREAALLEAEVQSISALYDQRRVISVREALEFRTAVGADTGFLYRFLGKEGQILAANTEWPGETPARGALPQVEDAQPFVFEAQGASFIGRAWEWPGGFRILIARSIENTEGALAAARSRILYLAISMSMASLLAGALASRIIMERVSRLNALADEVAGGNLNARIADPGADEFGILTRHIHAMLDRIGHLTRATERLASTVAHELRTPLTRIRNRIDRLDGPEYEAEALAAEIHETIRIFDSLLEIANAEADSGKPQDLAFVNLSKVATEMGALYGPAAEDKGLDWQVVIAEEQMILGDKALVSRLIANLLDNAIKFTPPGGEVLLSVESAQTGPILRVADTGPGLPSSLKTGGFDRFDRAGTDDSVPGHGLGLALCQAIATRHGAKLRAVPREKGLAMEVHFPKLPAR